MPENNTLSEGKNLSIVLCNGPAQAFNNNGDELRLTEDDRTLLKVLGLWPDGEYVPYSVISRWFPNVHNPVNIRSKVNRLRSRIKDSAAIDVSKGGSGCRLLRDRVTIDADQIFGEKVLLLDRWREVGKPCSTEDAENLWQDFEALRRRAPRDPSEIFSPVLGRWNRDDDGLSASYDAAYQVRDAWAELSNDFDLRFAEISFATKNPVIERPAEKSLQFLVTENRDAPHDAWVVLLKHLRTIASRELLPWIAKYRSWCEREGEQPDPSLVSEAEMKELDRRARLQPQANLDETDIQIIHIARLLGIVPQSVDGMLEANLSPMQILRRKPRQLLFAGTLASKWVAGSVTRRAFDSYLDEMDGLIKRNKERQKNARAPVRFLIMCPWGRAYQTLSEYREGRISNHHVEHLVSIDERHASIEIHTLDHLPRFRLQCIDFRSEAIASFALYPHRFADYQAEREGLSTPHFVARWRGDSGDNTILGRLVRGYFESLWENSKPLTMNGDKLRREL